MFNGCFLYFACMTVFLRGGCAAAVGAPREVLREAEAILSADCGEACLKVRMWPHQCMGVSLSRRVIALSCEVLRTWAGSAKFSRANDTDSVRAKACVRDMRIVRWRPRMRAGQ